MPKVGQGCGCQTHHQSPSSTGKAKMAPWPRPLGTQVASHVASFLRQDVLRPFGQIHILNIFICSFGFPLFTPIVFIFYSKFMFSDIARSFIYFPSGIIYLFFHSYILPLFSIYSPFFHHNFLLWAWNPPYTFLLEQWLWIAWYCLTFPNFIEYSRSISNPKSFTHLSELLLTDTNVFYRGLSTVSQCKPYQYQLDALLCPN